MRNLDGTPAWNLLRVDVIKNGAPMRKLFIAVCNFYVAIALRKLADLARQAIHKTGGDLFKFNTIAIVDGMVMRARWTLSPAYPETGGCCADYQWPLSIPWHHQRPYFSGSQIGWPD